MADKTAKEASSVDDIKNNKTNAVLSYFGILIIIPLLDENAKKSPFAKFHMNQGLILIIAGFIAGFVSWIPVIGWAISLALFIIWLIGVIGAAQGEMKKLPLIGDFQILK